MPPKEAKEELDLDEKKAQLAIRFNDAARQFSALADVLSKAVTEVPIDETTVNNLTELLNAVVAKPSSRKRKLAALDIGENGLPQKRKRERKLKDPNAPKGPASAYILFQNDIRAAYKKEHPDMANKDLLRLIGDQWKSLEEGKKDYYREQHSKAKKKHDVDLAAYNAQNPDAAPSDSKDSEKKKKQKEAPVAKEVIKAAPKTTKKAVAPKGAKVAPKSKEIVESSGDEAEDASEEVEASEEEESDDESAPKAKAKATSEDEDSSEEDASSSEEEAAPPPQKKSKK